tara:strand:+ start:555 stop:686 length:132 start_codon:yes stop_codon:yes gene_type:complete
VVEVVVVEVVDVVLALVLAPDAPDDINAVLEPPPDADPVDAVD